MRYKWGTNSIIEYDDQETFTRSVSNFVSNIVFEISNGFTTGGDLQFSNMTNLVYSHSQTSFLFQ